MSLANHRSSQVQTGETGDVRQQPHPYVPNFSPVSSELTAVLLLQDVDRKKKRKHKNISYTMKWCWAIQHSENDDTKALNLLHSTVQTI